jgi:hypothetical protein
MKSHRHQPSLALVYIALTLAAVLWFTYLFERHALHAAEAAGLHLGFGSYFLR